MGALILHGIPATLSDRLLVFTVLKVARHLFKWTASSSLGDFYERAIMNGIIGNQNKLDPAMTQFIYMLPLGAANMHKPWGKSNSGFPCCCKHTINLPQRPVVN